jgi:hypothetical protein
MPVTRQSCEPESVEVEHLIKVSSIAGKYPRCYNTSGHKPDQIYRVFAADRKNPLSNFKQK